MFEDQDDLSGVEAGHVLVEAAELAQVCEEFATGYVVEKNVEEFVVREGGDIVCYKGVPSYVGQNLALVSHVVDLLQLDYYGWLALPPLPSKFLSKPTLGLSEYLEGIHFAAIGFGAMGRPHEANTGKGS